MTPLIFFGSDRYSATVLSHLLTANGLRLSAVVTDQHADQSPVEKLAKTHTLKVAYYPDFDHSLITKNTLGLCASFDHLIPKEVIQKFGDNLYNLHPSLLPQYRNVSPVQYAIALGDKETGITLFRIAPTIDNGEIISQIAAPILPNDTTPTLTSRLFSLGAQLFIDSLVAPSGPGLAGPDYLPARPGPTGTLIFTHRLTRDSGFVEWPVLHTLIQNKPFSLADTKNNLLSLRLKHNPTGNILSDLLRALTPWPTVWSLVPTTKGELRISLESVGTDIKLKIAGKPAPISLTDFNKYYLE